MNASQEEIPRGMWNISLTMRRVLFTIALSLLIAGTACLVIGFRLRQAANERTVVLMRIEAGTNVQASIKTLGMAQLRVELAVDSSLALPEDLVDQIFFRETNGVDIGWEVRRGTTLIAAGSSTNFHRSVFGSPTVHVEIGAFKPPGAGTFDFRAKVNSSLSELNFGQPRIVILPNLRFQDDARFESKYWIGAGMMVTVFGLLLGGVMRKQAS